MPLSTESCTELPDLPRAEITNPLPSKAHLRGHLCTILGSIPGTNLYKCRLHDPKFNKTVVRYFYRGEICRLDEPELDEHGYEILDDDE